MSDELKVEEVGDVTIARLQGTAILDAGTIQGMSKMLYALADDRSKKKLVLDFTSVRFLSSQALGILLSTRGKAAANQGEIVLAGIRPELQRLFKLTKLDAVFRFFDAVDDALLHFGVNPPGDAEQPEV